MTKISSFFALSFGFVLAGCGDPEPIAKLSGSVVDMVGSPANEVTIHVGGKVATTDAAGQFVMTDVKAPYDLAVVPHNSLYLFAGLETDKPVVRVPDEILGPSTNLSHGDLTLDLGPEPDATEKLSYLVDLPDGHVLSGLETGAHKGNETHVGVLWEGEDAASVRVRAFRYQVGGDGAPVHYTGFATTTILVKRGDALSWTATWEPPPFGEKTLSFSASMPDGYVAWQATLTVKIGRNNQEFVGSTGSEHMSFVVPDLDDLSFGASVCAGDGFTNDCMSVPQIAPNAEVKLEQGPALTSAGADGLLGPGDSIEWQRDSDSPVFISLSPKDDPLAPQVFIESGDDSIEMPDLAAFGLAWPKGVTYTISVFQNGNYKSIEDLAAHDPFSAIRTGGSYGQSQQYEVKMR